MNEQLATGCNEASVCLSHFGGDCQDPPWLRCKDCPTACSQVQNSPKAWLLDSSVQLVQQFQKSDHIHSAYRACGSCFRMGSAWARAKADELGNDISVGPQGLQALFCLVKHSHGLRDELLEVYWDGFSQPRIKDLSDWEVLRTAPGKALRSRAP